MLPEHQYAEEFLAHLGATQLAYEQRRIGDYLAGFSENYASVQLNTDWSEDKPRLEEKIVADFERFELLSMDFSILRHWFAGDTGFAHLGYHTRLKYRESGRVLVDQRENLIVGEHLGDGRWLVKCKVVLSASNYFETESQPDI